MSIIPSPVRTVYALFTSDGLDQICYTQTQSMREASDLRQMGCDVTVKRFIDESSVYVYCEKRGISA